MTKPSSFTPEQDATIIRMKAEGYGRSDIAFAIGMDVTRTGKRADYLRASIQRLDTLPTLGWPVPDPRKINDWPDFGKENVKLPSSNPRYMQAPVRHSSGVASYG